jgi:hypothetical protein
MPNLSPYLHQLFHESRSLLHVLADFAPFGAVLVFAVALAQYIRAESWRRTEFVANLYKEFSENEDCKRALWMLQGDKRKLYYKEGETLHEYQCNDDVIRIALTEAIAENQLSPSQLHIRDTLDNFFIYIEQFDRAIQRRLVSQRDVFPYFGYWIDLLTVIPDDSPRKSTLDKIIEYIDHAGFDDVQKFLGRKWE